MCVVPVVIKHKDSTKEIITHTILDSCSQGTFIVEDLVNGLEIDGIDTYGGENTKLARSAKVEIG